MSIARSLLLTLLLGGACATPPPPPPPATEPVAPSTTAPAPTAPIAATGPVAWSCRDELVPPAGYLQETAFVDGSDTQAAVERARAQMRARLCTASTGSCDGLAELVTTWKTGNDAGRACAMVVVQQSAFATWKARQGLDGFDVALQTSVASVLSGLKTPVVALDSIVDGGVAGGERAVWVQTRLAAALSARGVRMIEVPSTFTGVGLPKGATVLLGARTVTRHENNERKLEISLQARVKEGGTITRRVGPPVVVLASAAPPMTSELPALPVDDAVVTLRLQPFDTTIGTTALCAGDKVQLTLSSSARRHVRVIDLYGEGDTAGAVLLFPNDERTDDVVAENATIALGGSGGFEAVPVPGTDVERFVVIAATTPAGLGAFGRATTACRLSPALTKQLHAGKFASGVDVTSTGFRVLPPSMCARPSPSPQQLSALTSSLASLPVCP